jgi:hypothetical protein
VGESVWDLVYRGGDGGPGAQSNILGINYFFGGGGGGGAYYWPAEGQRGGNGGAGGGGAGSVLGTSGSFAQGGGSALNAGESVTGGGSYYRAGSGGANTGGGGGGTGHDGISGAGGSGVVIVRYTPTKDLVWDKNSTAQSFAYTNSQVIPTTGNWTYEAWYYLDSDDVSAGWRGLFSQMDTTQAYTQRVSIWLNSGKIHVTTPTTNLDVPSYTFLANRWYHMAYARNGNDVEFFINGVKVLDQTVANWGTIGPEFAIGGARQWDSNYAEISGAIDQVKVWSTALDQPSVQASMNTYSTSGVTGTLKAHYDFNEFESGIVRDRSGNNNNLVFNTDVAGGYLSSNFNENFLLETGTAHNEQTFVKFNRTYLAASGGWTPPSGVTRYKALVVAGGGAGGKSDTGTYENGGGGGAGGYLERSLLTTSAVVPIQVGQGGVGIVYPPTNGVNSSALGLTSIGGGRGGSHGSSNNNGANGGSGGGGTNWVGMTGGTATAGQGNNGGGAGLTGDTNGGSGGGGGAGAVGGAGSGNTGGVGGAGRTSSITGTPRFYAAGGGGAGGTGGAGGSSIGGAGATATGSGQVGANNTGAGGGGNFALGNNTTMGGDGGSGVVIISYGPYLEVTRSPIAVIPGNAFQSSIQLQVTDELTGARLATNASVTVTASSNVLTINGTLLTQSYTVNAVNGIVDFAGL